MSSPPYIAMSSGDTHTPVGSGPPYLVTTLWSTRIYSCFFFFTRIYTLPTSFFFTSLVFGKIQYYFCHFAGVFLG